MIENHQGGASAPPATLENVAMIVTMLEYHNCSKIKVSIDGRCEHVPEHVEVIATIFDIVPREYNHRTRRFDYKLRSVSHRLNGQSISHRENATLASSVIHEHLSTLL